MTASKGEEERDSTFRRKGTNRQQLVHSAREGLLNRIAKYNDPDNEDWDWEDVNDKWERHALAAVQDLVAVEAERDSLITANQQLREACEAALPWVEANTVEACSSHGSNPSQCLECHLRANGLKLAARLRAALSKEGREG